VNIDFKLLPLNLNIDFWFYGFCTVCEVNFSTMFRDRQRLPKRRREIYLPHRAKTLKPEIKRRECVKRWLLQSSEFCVKCDAQYSCVSLAVRQQASINMQA
jgi:hypothetical protein